LDIWYAYHSLKATVAVTVQGLVLLIVVVVVAAVFNALFLLASACHINLTFKVGGVGRVGRENVEDMGKQETMWYFSSKFK